MDEKTKIDGIQCDYESLKIKFSKQQDDSKYLHDKIEFLMANISIISDTFNLPLKYKTKCKTCEGYGRVYIPPISDMGQDSRCMECKAKGYIWAAKKNDVDAPMLEMSVHQNDGMCIFSWGTNRTGKMIAPEIINVIKDANKLREMGINDRDILIVQLKFGIIDKMEHSFKEISKKVWSTHVGYRYNSRQSSISADRVRQVTRIVIRKIERKLNENNNERLDK